MDPLFVCALVPDSRALTAYHCCSCCCPQRQSAPYRHWDPGWILPQARVAAFPGRLPGALDPSPVREGGRSSQAHTPVSLTAALLTVVNARRFRLRRHVCPAFVSVCPWSSETPLQTGKGQASPPPRSTFVVRHGPLLACCHAFWGHVCLVCLLTLTKPRGFPLTVL